MVYKKVISFVLLFFALACNFTNSVKKCPVRKRSRQKNVAQLNRELIFKRSRSKKQNYFNYDGRKLLLGSIVASPFLCLDVGAIIYLCSNDKKALPKLLKNDDNIKVIDETKMRAIDEQFIKNNFFLCGWKNNSCWNDVFTQFLMLPDIRCRKYDSVKINKTIEWINKQLNEKYNGNFLDRKIYIPTEYRPISDQCENWLKDGVYHQVSNLFFGKFNDLNWKGLGLVSIFWRHDTSNYSAICSDLSDAFDTLGKQTAYQNNYLVHFQNSGTFSNPNTPKPALEDVQGLFECHSGYYPTFIIVGNGNHYCSCVIIYDVNNEVKFVLWLDGMEQGMQIISKQQILQKLSDLSNKSEVYIVFSCHNIVKRYYTSC